MMRTVLLICVLVILVQCSSDRKENSIEQESAQPPNIIVILADDVGFSDIGPYGGEINTPNLDLAEDPTELNNLIYSYPERKQELVGLYQQWEIEMGI
jgi:arylsulfatase